MSDIYAHQCKVLHELTFQLEHTPYYPDDDVYHQTEVRKRAALKRAIEQQHMEMDAYLEETLAAANLKRDSMIEDFVAEKPSHYRDTMWTFFRSMNGDVFSSGDVVSHVHLLHPNVSRITVQAALYEQVGVVVERLGYNQYRMLHQK